MADKAEQYEQLTAYLDGELPEAKRAEVERLLASDESARLLLEELRQTSRLVASLPRARAPSNLAQTVTAQLERDALLGDAPDGPAGDTRRPALWRALSIAAALALVVTAGWLVFPLLPIGEQARPSFMLVDSERTRGLDDAANGEAERLRSDVIAMAEGKDGEPPDSLSDGRRGTVPPLAKAQEDAVSKAARVGLTTGTEVAKANEPQPPKGVGHRRDARATTMVKAAEPAVPLGKADVEEAIETHAFTAPREEKAAFRKASAPRPGGRARFEGHGPEGEFDRQLAANVLANTDLWEASAAAFSNRVVVKTDARTQARLLRHISTFMESNQIPDARTEALPEPIGAGQPFYLTKEQTEPARSRLGVRGGFDEIEVLMNVSQSQAAHLIASMEEVTARDESTAVWEANDVRVTDANVAPEIIRQLVTADRGEGFVRGPVVPDASTASADGEPHPAMRRAPRAVGSETKKLDLKTDETRAKESASRGPGRGKGQPAAGKAAPLGRPGRGSRGIEGRRGGLSRALRGEEGTSQEPAAGGPVTLAISLRSVGPSELPQDGMWKPGTETGAAPRPVMRTPSSTSRPTSQGATGG